MVTGGALSVLYEWGLDRNGWNLTDLRQRAYGQLGAEVLWALL